MHNGVRGHQEHGQVATGGRGSIPLLQFFAYKIRTHEKVRKGEGEPGDEASMSMYCRFYCKVSLPIPLVLIVVCA